MHPKWRHWLLLRTRTLLAAQTLSCVKSARLHTTRK